MRSRPFKIEMRDRLWGRRHNIHTTVSRKPRRICRLHEGRLLQGHASQHRMPEARQWRTQLRLIRQRANSAQPSQEPNT